MWKARITQVSQVDASGHFEISFDVYLDNVLLYANLVRRGDDKQVLQDAVKETLRSYKRQVAESKKVQVGDIISI